MLIGLLIKCLSGPIHILLSHPQLLFNLCPAIVHLFNWLQVRRSGKGSSPPYRSTAQCDANYSRSPADLNDKWHNFHWKSSNNRQQRLRNQPIAFPGHPTYSFPIKIYLSKQTKSKLWIGVCHAGLISMSEWLLCDLLKDGSISFFRPAVTNKKRLRRCLRLDFSVNCIAFLARTLKPTGLNRPSSTDRPHSDAHLPVRLRLGVTLLPAIWQETRKTTWRKNYLSPKMSVLVNPRKSTHISNQGI